MDTATALDNGVNEPIELSDKHNMEIEEQDLLEYTQKHVTWTQIIGGSVGNILEWYDFAGIVLLYLI